MMTRTFIRFSLLVILALGMVLPVRAADTAGLPVGSYQSGPFTVTIAADGTYRVVHAGGGAITGIYKVTGNQIEVTDQGGDFACFDGAGKYSWKAEGDKLLFSLTEDPCQGRSRVLAEGPLVPLVEDRLAGVWKGTWERTGGSGGTFQLTIEKNSDGKSGTVRVEQGGNELYTAGIREASVNGNKMMVKYDSPDGQAEILLEGEWLDKAFAGTWSYRPSGESAYTPAGTWKASKE